MITRASLLLGIIAATATTWAAEANTTDGRSAQHLESKNMVMRHLMRAKRDAQFDVQYNEFGIPTYKFQDGATLEFIPVSDGANQFKPIFSPFADNLARVNRPRQRFVRPVRRRTRPRSYGRGRGPVDNRVALVRVQPYLPTRTYNTHNTAPYAPQNAPYAPQDPQGGYGGGAGGYSPPPVASSYGVTSGIPGERPEFENTPTAGFTSPAGETTVKTDGTTSVTDYPEYPEYPDPDTTASSSATGTTPEYPEYPEYPEPDTTDRPTVTKPAVAEYPEYPEYPDLSSTPASTTGGASEVTGGVTDYSDYGTAVVTPSTGGVTGPNRPGYVDGANSEYVDYPDYGSSPSAAKPDGTNTYGNYGGGSSSTETGGEYAAGRTGTPLDVDVKDASTYKGPPRWPNDDGTDASNPAYTSPGSASNNAAFGTAQPFESRVGVGDYGDYLAPQFGNGGGAAEHGGFVNSVGQGGPPTNTAGHQGLQEPHVAASMPPALFNFVFGAPTLPESKRRTEPNTSAGSAAVDASAASEERKAVIASVKQERVLTRRQRRIARFVSWRVWRRDELLAPGSVRLVSFVHYLVNSRKLYISDAQRRES